MASRLRAAQEGSGGGDLIEAPSDEVAERWGQDAAMVYGGAAEELGRAPKLDEVRAGGAQRLWAAVRERVEPVTKAAQGVALARDRVEAARGELDEAEADRDASHGRWEGERDGLEAANGFALVPEIGPKPHLLMLLGIGGGEFLLSRLPFVEFGEGSWVTNALALVVGFGIALAAYLIGMSLRRVLEPPRQGSQGRQYALAAAVMTLVVGAGLVALHGLRHHYLEGLPGFSAPSWPLMVVQALLAVTGVAVTLLAESPARDKVERLHGEYTDAEEARDGARQRHRDAEANLERARWHLHATMSKALAYLSTLDEHTRRQLDMFVAGFETATGSPRPAEAATSHDGQVDEVLARLGWDGLAAPTQPESVEQLLRSVFDGLGDPLGDGPGGPRGDGEGGS